MNQIENEYKGIIASAVEKITAMGEGEVALLEDLLGNQYDVFTLLSIGNAIESELSQHKIWLKFEEEDECFQCKYNQKFQKWSEWLVDIRIVYPKKCKLYRSGDNMIEGYTVFACKNPTINGGLTFCTGKKQLQTTIHKDFSENQHIDFTKLSTAVNNIINQYSKYKRNSELLSKEHYDRVLMRINGVEYLITNDDCNFKELKDAIGYCNMHEELTTQKNDGIKQGLSHEPSLNGETTCKHRKKITIKQAMLIANNYYSDNNSWVIFKIYDAEGAWIVLAKRKDGSVCFGGGNNIIIDKSTGEIKRYVYRPSSESAKLLQNAKLKFSTDKNDSLLRRLINIIKRKRRNSDAR